MVFGAGGASTPGYRHSKPPVVLVYRRQRRQIWPRCEACPSWLGCSWCLVQGVPFPQRAAAWGALYGPLPGELQGSDRAEIWALLQLLERTLGDLVVGTDCDCLVKCFYKAMVGSQGLASRMVTCGVESGPRSIAGAKSLSSRLGRMCWLLIPLLNWLLTPGQVLWAMSLLTLLLRKEPFSHEVPIDVLRAVTEADFLAVRIQKQLYTTVIQAVPELKGSAKAPGSREARRLTLFQLMAATDHDLLRDPLKLQGQWHCSRCGHDCSQATSRMAVECALCPTVAHGASGPFPRLSTRIDWSAGLRMDLTKLAYKRGIWWCVTCGSWASSAARNLRQALYRPSHKGSERRSGSFGQGAHAESPRPVAVSHH